MRAVANIKDIEAIGSVYANNLERAMFQLLAANEPSGHGDGWPGGNELTNEGNSRSGGKSSSRATSRRSATTNALLYCALKR
jgi:hypothetical protein